MHLIRYAAIFFAAILTTTYAQAQPKEDPHRLVAITPEESVIRVNLPPMSAEPSRSWKRDTELFRAVEEYSTFVGPGRLAIVVHAVAAPGVNAGKGDQAKEYAEYLRGFLFDRSLKLEWREAGEGQSTFARDVPYQIFSISGSPIGCASFVRNYEPGRRVNATKRLAGIYCQTDNAALPHQAIKDFIAAISIRS